MNTAVIGSGVSGLTAAYLLQRTGPVTLYEAEPRLGGHAHTHRVVGPDGVERFLDTGFLVYNRANYPNLDRLFGELGVATESTDMSLSVTCRGCGLAYSSGSGMRALPRRLAAADGPGLVTETAEFNRQARTLLEGSCSPELTLAKMLANGGFSRRFIDHVILPLVSIVWSCDPETAGDYPVGALLAFLHNHGLLSSGEATRWRTVTGGSRTYVERIAATLTEVRTSAPVRAVHRNRDHVEIHERSGAVDRFDRVVIAVHPQQALALLADPTPAEQRIMGALPYVRNTALLHMDESVLPARAPDRSSWNHRQASCRPAAGDYLASYSLNRLQNLDSPVHYIVTLGATDLVDPAHVLARMDYEHPLYTVSSGTARAGLRGLATSRTVYAGAYHGWGFHEDGCRSGAAAAKNFGATW